MRVMLIFLVLLFAFGCKKSEDPEPMPVTTVTDADGNIYHTVTIGSQTWLVENLRTTKFNDGTPVPLVTSGSAWIALSTPGYCWLNNDVGYKNIYGALYNWFAVSSGKLAPTGWHVATDDEWEILVTFLGGEAEAGGKLKEAGLHHWASPNEGADNSTGFTGLPGGARDGTTGFFASLGTQCDFWTISEYGAPLALDRSLFYYDAAVSSGADSKKDGNSVRCIKN